MNEMNEIKDLRPTIPREGGGQQRTVQAACSRLPTEQQDEATKTSPSNTSSFTSRSTHTANPPSSPPRALLNARRHTEPHADSHFLCDRIWRALPPPERSYHGDGGGGERLQRMQAGHDSSKTCFSGG